MQQPNSDQSGLTPQQAKQFEWTDQWTRYREGDDTIWLFDDWIAPVTLEDLRGCAVLEAGCGPGHHTVLLADVARHVTAVDLNTASIAQSSVGKRPNVEVLERDLANMNLGKQFDAVICVGVIHHTDDPDRSFKNLFRHCRPGGRMIVWAYSAEGNELVRWLVEPFRKIFLRNLPRGWVNALSYLICALIWPIIQTIYRLPLKFLPYWAYFDNARKLGFRRTAINIFDKLNAPQTDFISRERAEKWMSPDRFHSISIRHYCGVSYSMSGVRRNEFSN